MKYLITGYSGFVSRHFLEYLNNKAKTEDQQKSNFNRPEILCIDICYPTNFPIYSHLSLIKKHINLLDYNLLKKEINDFKPDRILHLASFSSVAKSWEYPQESFSNNTNIFLNLVEAVRHTKTKCRILSIGSSEEYGNVKPSDVPLTEEHSLKPISPYAVARVSQEMLSKIFVDSFGLDIVLTRSFNHIGTGQRDIFVIPSFIHQICSQIIENPVCNVQLDTGNVDIIRDFLDVRDVVTAYDSLFEKGIAGECYNVCSGNGNSLRKIIEIVAELTKANVCINVDKDKIRPNDNNIIIGSHQKITNQTGWIPKYSLKDSLNSIILEWLDIAKKEIQ